MNWLINKRINKITNESIKEWINQPINQPVNHLINQPTNKTTIINPSVNLQYKYLSLPIHLRCYLESSFIVRVEWVDVRIGGQFLAIPKKKERLTGVVLAAGLEGVKEGKRDGMRVTDDVGSD